jgi:hypothetical protein
VLPVNPANDVGNEFILPNVHEAARTIGLQIQVLNATTISEMALYTGAPVRRPA